MVSISTEDWDIDFKYQKSRTKCNCFSVDLGNGYNKSSYENNIDIPKLYWKATKQNSKTKTKKNKIKRRAATKSITKKEEFMLLKIDRE